MKFQYFSKMFFPISFVFILLTSISIRHAFTEETHSRPSAFLHLDFDYSTEGWDHWMTEGNIVWEDDTRNGFFSVSLQNGFVDDNHVLNVGNLYLPGGIRLGPLGGKLSVYLGGGRPDLRNAKINVSVRGVDFAPNGAEYVLLIQSQSNVEKGNHDWKRANWLMIQPSLTQYLLDGQWHDVELTLTTDPRDWIFAGNNPEQDNSKRYEYWPLEQSLAHANVSMGLILAYIDKNNPPKGRIEIDDLKITYQNHSLLHPENGAGIVETPKGKYPAEQLTDGFRNGTGYVWRSLAGQSPPFTFLYDLGSSRRIDTIQIHQNSHFPTKNLSCWISQDGKTFDQILNAEIPLPSEDPNLDFYVKSGLETKARFIKFFIERGYREGPVGLGELEVFSPRLPAVKQDDVRESLKLAEAADTQIASKNISEGLKKYQQAVQMLPQYADLQMRIGKNLIQNNILEPAELFLVSALQVTPQNPEASYWLARLYKDTGKSAEQVKRFAALSLMGFAKLKDEKRFLRSRELLDALNQSSDRGKR